MFSNFTNSDLAMIATALEEEDVNWRRQHTSRKRKWIRSTMKKRKAEGEFYTLLPKLIKDETKFYEYFKMTISTFDKLLTKLKEKLKKEDTFWRPSIEPKQRLAVCLRFLATGDSFRTISFKYRLGSSTVATIVHDTCTAMVDVLLDEVMPMSNEDIWYTVENAFSILHQKLRIFAKRLHRTPDNITMVVLAACILHNFVQQNEDFNLPEKIENQSERNEPSEERSSDLHRRSTEATLAVREQLKNLLKSPGDSVNC